MRFSWLVLLFALLIVPVGLAEVISVPGSIVVNATSTAGLLEYPGGSFGLAGNVSASIPFNLSVSVDGANESVTLDPGEVRVVSGRYDRLSLTCEAGAGVGACGINATLGWGETYTRTDEVCDVRIKCDPTDAPSNVTYNVSSVVHISKDGGNFIFELDNRTETISAGVINASFDVPLTFFCPLTPFESLTEEQARITYDMCATYFPLVNDWLNLSLNRCFDNFDAYHEFVKTHDATIAASNQELSDCRASVGRMEGELQEKQSELVILNEQLATRDRDASFVTGAFVFVTVLLVISGVLNALQWSWGDQER